MCAMQRLRCVSKCKNCGSPQLIVDCGEYVCRDCGRVQGPTYNENTSIEFLGNNSNGYKRVFYFNERLTRWSCCEPKIISDVWELIRDEAGTLLPSGDKKYPGVNTSCNRALISKILRNVEISPEMAETHRSKKFRKLPLTKKRFYDKYFEKWKTIRWKLTGQKPVMPSHQLVSCIKVLFGAMQAPFEIYRHHKNCDGRRKCEKYFKCVHNFLNYDLVFRALLQLAEELHGFRNAYVMFKDEFTLPARKIIQRKLKPMLIKICEYNQWPVPVKDLK